MRPLEKHEVKAVNKIARLAPKPNKTVMPIMSYLLIEMGDNGTGGLKVTASDLDNTIVYHSGIVPDHGIGVVRGLVRVDHWTAYAPMVSSTGALPTLDIEMGAVVINGIKCETVSIEEYPNVIPVVNDEARKPAVHGMDLLSGIETVRAAMSKDKTRYNMNGVHVVADKNGGRVEATDGYRALRAAIGGLKADLDAKFNFILADTSLPWIDAAAALMDLDYASIVQANGDRFKLTGSSEQAAIRLWCRPIDGEFPPLDEVLKSIGKPTTTIQISAPRLVEVEQLAQISKALPSKKGKEQSVRVEVVEGVVTVKASFEGGATRAVKLSETVKGKNTIIGMNCAYLIDTLKSLKGSVTVQISGELDGVLFKSETAQGPQLGVIMPMRP